MTGRDYLTVYTRRFRDAMAEAETVYAPQRTRAERYMRGLVPDIFNAQGEYRRANYSDEAMIVLVPRSDMGQDEESAQEIHGGRILGLPVAVVHGIDKPMLAVELERRIIP